MWASDTVMSISNSCIKYEHISRYECIWGQMLEQEAPRQMPPQGCAIYLQIIDVFSAPLNLPLNLYINIFLYKFTTNTIIFHTKHLFIYSCYSWSSIMKFYLPFLPSNQTYSQYDLMNKHLHNKPKEWTWLMSWKITSTKLSTLLWEGGFTVQHMHNTLIM